MSEDNERVWGITDTAVVITVMMTEHSAALPMS